MKIEQAEYVTSAYLPSQIPEEKFPEISFIGRSNVGKSSLINTLVTRNNLAHISKKPGKTRTINYFLINDDLYFVDLPGYGFAKVSKKMKKDWEELITTYLTDRKSLRVSVLLLDARHGPTTDDINMLDFLLEFKRPVILVATKIDKVKNQQRNKRLKEMRKMLDIGEDDLLIPFSSTTGEGKQEFLEIIEDVL
ncbi:ribosome biogenesis GTP-binding protein YihA/YsxC [Natranaerobius trueperi]|uniref:Probable GTP-binding protein EngB n=1 Tax=Natranaerobius trueperi TaxID=759412 RepID=A0A226BY87_9FIRM|nr:ribosome biogenesis GTP-binding protein YihA/YsxC [Natranaerobius trueperi]OWZ83891.1 YihA family ribosome biogenesis GTP-binding protein [Natranaerobius trueperi]